MTRHIGIVGCSAEGAALCYRTICTEGAALLGPHAHPEVSMHTPSLAEYVACLERGDLDGVAALMLASAEKLARAGRSEEHTSELQSLMRISYAVFCLKKKKPTKPERTIS